MEDPNLEVVWCGAQTRPGTTTKGELLGSYTSHSVGIAEVVTLIRTRKLTARLPREERYSVGQD